MPNQSKIANRVQRLDTLTIFCFVMYLLSTRIIPLTMILLSPDMPCHCKQCTFNSDQLASEEAN